tara:strand:- start:2547 stop:3935 length:1389 start_codon:yes stop_codon:yes gene_type:complete
MATTITQKPYYTTLPVGQDIIFTVSNAVVTTYFNVKFIAEVYISNTTPSTATANLIGTFKTTPNNAGVGMFDFSAVVENHVKADNLGAIDSAYKGTPTTASSIPPSLHLIDKYSFNDNAMRWLIIKFSLEGSVTATSEIISIGGAAEQSINYRIFNGYLKYTNKLDVSNDDFGLNIGSGSDTPIQLGAAASSFLTNAPTTQYANIDDYGTVGVLPTTYLPDFHTITFTYYNSAGGSLGSEDLPTGLLQNANIIYHLLYIGCFPANLRNWSSTFQALVTAGTIQGGYYTVQALDPSRNAVSQLYTIHVNCPELKNYEPIRLAWLNQWGAWDYYTFTKKSTRTISTQGSTYTQLEGTWNEAAFRLSGYRGGKKSFRVNASEKIKMNTDFVSEADGEWFEELINSPEVYMLEGFQTDSANALLNTYVTPVRLTTSSYTRKTIANDRLMQYTFEVEKTKTFRTQAI